MGVHHLLLLAPLDVPVACAGTAKAKATTEIAAIMIFRFIIYPCSASRTLIRFTLDHLGANILPNADDLRRRCVLIVNAPKRNIVNVKLIDSFGGEKRYRVLTLS